MSELTKQIQHLIADWLRRHELHQRVGIDGNYEMCSRELELVLKGKSAEEAAILANVYANSSLSSSQNATQSSQTENNAISK